MLQQILYQKEKYPSYSFYASETTESMIKILLLHTPLKNEGLLSDKENRKLKNLRHKNYKLTTIKCIDLLLSRKDIYYNTNKYIKYEDYIINNYIFNDKIKAILKDKSNLKLEENDTNLELNKIKSLFYKIKKEFYENKSNDTEYRVLELFKLIINIMHNCKSFDINTHELEETKRISIFINQLAIYKSELLDTFVDLWSFYNLNFYSLSKLNIKNEVIQKIEEDIKNKDHKYRDSNLSKEIYKIFLEILLLLSNDNPIIITILLSNSYLVKVDSKFKDEFYRFYYNIINNLKKMNFNADLRDLICKVENEIKVFIN